LKMRILQIIRWFKNFRRKSKKNRNSVRLRKSIETLKMKGKASWGKSWNCTLIKRSYQSWKIRIRMNQWRPKCSQSSKCQLREELLISIQLK
jgi:predicted helicase